MIAEVAGNARFREEANRQEEFSRTRNVVKDETPPNQMTEEIKQMKEMVQKLMMNQVVRVKTCEFCGGTNHKTDSCHSLQDEEHGHINAQGGYNQYQQRGQNYNQAGPSNESSNKSLENIVKELAASR
ncbi:unnamed protein product [Rhodiola kirilowii]